MREASSDELPVPNDGVVADDVQTTLRTLDRVARFYDSAFGVPGTKIRVGWDSIFGLIPGVGDFVGVVPLFYYLQVARRYRLGTGVYLRLAANQLIDFVIGTIPLVGDLFDVGFKANLKNAKLLRERLQGY